jgi:FkbM family methyltransferase
MDQPPPTFLRGLAERISRGKSFNRTLQTVDGPRRICVTPEASLRYWLPKSLNSDGPLCDFAARHIRPGQKIWDIGANIGIFTFLAAASVGANGQVLSVEADPYISQLLIRSTLHLPSRDAVPDILTAAISNKNELAAFAVPNRSRASSHLLSSTGCTQTGGIRFSFRVPCITMDWLLGETFQPDIVKMDIEGIEYIALAGAPSLLKARPLLHLEIWSEIAKPLTQLLHANGYLLFDGEKDLGLTSPVAGATWCTVAVPAEKHAAYQGTG